jgi:hypothetical protein
MSSFRKRENSISQMKTLEKTPVDKVKERICILSSHLDSVVSSNNQIEPFYEQFMEKYGSQLSLCSPSKSKQPS